MPTIEHVKSRKEAKDGLYPKTYDVNNPENYIITNMYTNSRRKHMNFRMYLRKHKEFISNLVDYFDALLKSKNKLIVKYAEASLNNVLEELRGMHSDLVTRRVVLSKKP